MPNIVFLIYSCKKS